jgi:hypothetical protein
MHTEKIDVASGMAILQGPVPLKTGVVPFCTLPSLEIHVKSAVGDECAKVDGAPV